MWRKNIPIFEWRDLVGDFGTIPQNNLFAHTSMACAILNRVIHDRDPLKNKNAKKYDHISYERVLAEKLGVMDATAISLCQSIALPILVFNMQRLFTDDPYTQILPPQSQGTLVDANQKEL